MSPQQRHRDVAAYALGVLEPADSFRFEEHLADCVVCAIRLGEFSHVAEVLAPYAGPEPAATLPLERPSPELLDRLLGTMATLRGRTRRRWLRLTAVAAALVLAAPLGPLALRESGTDPQLLSATDATTGVSAAVTTADRDWGADVGLTLARVRGPLTCALVAVGTDGAEQTVTTWSVPRGGYGIPDSPGHEKPLVVQGSTALRGGGIDHFEVRTAEGRRLVSVGR